MKRIQRKRTKGWRMPSNTIYVGRPSRWGNPFTLKFRRHEIMTDQRQEREHAIACYRDLLRGFSPEELGEYLAPLKGKDLACWCPLDELCHADILIEFLKEAGLEQ